MNLEHLKQEAEKEAGEPKQDSLLTITALAQEWKERKAAYILLECQAAEAKKLFNEVSQEKIPNAMMEVGLSELKLADGEKVSFKEDVSCSIKDYNKLDEWLSERGEDGIIKITLEMGKVPRNILSMILQELMEKYDISAVPKQFVHNQTMSAHIRRICGINGKTEAEVAVADIDDTMLSVFRYYKTTIK